MPSFVKQSNNTWRAFINVKGKRMTRTFPTKRKAQDWARDKETELHANVDNDLPDKTFGELLQRYLDEVVPTKRSIKRETNFIRRFMKDPLADINLRKLETNDFKKWRDERLDSVSHATVIRELVVLSHVCSTASKEWQWLKENPVTDVRRPATPKERTRRPTPEESEALVYVLGYEPDKPPETKSSRVGAIYLFACETAIRAGEICKMKWKHVYDQYVHLPGDITKNGHPRDVPFTNEASRIIDQVMAVTQDKEYVFDMNSSTLDALFRKAKRKANIHDLHFHDSRREALTRLSHKLSVMELARVSGHRDLRILQNVYYAPSVDDLASKIRVDD